MNVLDINLFFTYILNLNNPVVLGDVGYEAKITI